MTQPPNDPASGEPEESRPQGRQEPPHGQPGRPGPHDRPYGGQPQGEQPPYGAQQPYGQQPHGQGPYYEQQPYGQGPYEQGPYGQYPYGQDPYGYGGAPGYGTGGHTEPASRWARLAAGIIDLLVIGIIAGLISLPFVNWNRVFDSTPGAAPYNGYQVWTNAVSVIVAFLYFWLMHAKWGQTLGKMLLRIRVVRADDAQAIGGGQAAARSAFYSVLGNLCCIGVIDVLWILFDPRRQALHCKIAQTVVVRDDPRVPNPYARR